MNAQEIHTRLQSVEERVDEAVRAVRTASAPQELTDCVDTLHRQAREAKDAGDDGLRDRVMRLEDAADKAMQACRSAGNAIDTQTQEAIGRAHAEVSQLKKQVEAGSPA